MTLKHLRRDRSRCANGCDIGAQLKAGTNCGSCIPELKRLIVQTPVQAAPQAAVAI